MLLRSTLWSPVNAFTNAACSQSARNAKLKHAQRNESTGSPSRRRCRGQEELGRCPCMTLACSRKHLRKADTSRSPPFSHVNTPNSIKAATTDLPSAAMALQSRLANFGSMLISAGGTPFCFKLAITQIFVTVAGSPLSAGPVRNEMDAWFCKPVILVSRCFQKSSAGDRLVLLKVWPFSNASAGLSGHVMNSLLLGAPFKLFSPLLPKELLHDSENFQRGCTSIPFFTFLCQLEWKLSVHCDPDPLPGYVPMIPTQKPANHSLFWSQEPVLHRYCLRKTSGVTIWKYCFWRYSTAFLFFDPGHLKARCQTASKSCTVGSVHHTRCCNNI